MEKQNRYKNFIILSFSTVFGLGFFPTIPGTVGSLATVGIFILIQNRWLFALFCISAIIISLFVSGKSEKILGKKDAKQIVIDEVAGQSAALLFIPKAFVFIFLSFFLFRLFDIFKIYPANLIQKQKGSMGVLGDDLVAGIYTNIIIHTIIFLSKIF